MKKFILLLILLSSVVCNAQLSGLGNVPLTPAPVGLTGSNAVPSGSILNNITINNANITTQPLWVMCAFNNTYAYQFWLYTSSDCTNFVPLGGDKIAFVDNASGYRLRDPRWLQRSNTFYITSLLKFNDPHTVIYASTNFSNWYSNQSPNVGGSIGVSTVWGSRWFTDPTDGSIHYMWEASTNGSSYFLPYEQHLTNSSDFTSWSSPTLLGGTNGGQWKNTVYTNGVDYEFVYDDGKYYCFFKQQCDADCKASAYIALAESDSLTNGWGIKYTNNWAGWGVGYEGISHVLLPDGSHRLFFEDYSGSGIYSSDCSAANFPAGPWSTKIKLGTPTQLSNPGFIYFTNAVDQIMIDNAKSALSKSAIPMDIKNNTDYLVGANLLQNGTGTAWNTTPNDNTNLPSIFVDFLYSDTSSKGFYFFVNAKPGYPITSPSMFGSILSSGWNGPVVGTTVTANSLTTSNAIFYNKLTAPTPASLGANGGQLWKSNTVLYWSYTADGSTSNNAVKIAP